MLDNTPSTTEAPSAPASTPAPEAPAQGMAAPSPSSEAPKSEATSEPKTEEEFLSQVYRKAMSEDAGDAPKAEAQEQTEQPDSEGRQRDERGRFIGKASGDETKQTAEPEGTEQAEQQDEQEPEAKAAEEAPKSNGGEFRGWSKEEREAFAKLPKEAQDFVLNRQKATTNFFQGKVNELVTYARNTAPLIETVQKNAEYLESVASQLKLPAHEIISNLMATEQTLRFGSFEQKAATLAAMAKDYGIPIQVMDADPLADPTAPGGEAYAKFHDLQQQNARLQARLDAIERSQEHQHHEYTAKQLQSFASATDESGQPRFPHFELVRHRMGELITSGQADSLEDAYHKASAPIRHALSRAEAATRHASEARRAGRINVITAPQPVERYGSEDEALRAAYRQAMAS